VNDPGNYAMKLAYYPGCSMESSARIYASSLRAVFDILGWELVEIPDWNCCGASSAHVIPKDQATALSAANLAVAGRMNLDVVTACAACFFRLRTAADAMETDPELRDRVNRILPVPYEKNVKVYSVLDVLMQVVQETGFPEIQRKLGRLDPVCYYGCLFLRAPGGSVFDEKEDPRSMETVLKAAGISAKEWSYKLECCGVSAAVTEPRTAGILVDRIVSDARDRGAASIVTACPMCQLNLDLGQHNPAHALPVFFITQVLGLAWGLTERELGIGNLVSGAATVSGVLS